MDEASALVIEGLTLELLGETARQSIKSRESGTPRWLTEARDLLHAGFSRRLTIEDIAKSVDVHPIHLARVFRARYHCTIGDYVRRLRIEFARREIAGTKSSLAQIALDAGFYDHSHFSKAFKQLTGLTPTAYRKSFRAR